MATNGDDTLQLLLFGAYDLDLNGDEVIEAINDADLIISLGDVDLSGVAPLLPASKPALTILGDMDAKVNPPAPFRLLRANGVKFNGWRIYGLSGGPQRPDIPPRSGAYLLSEPEAAAALGRAPDCDILLTHGPPAGIEGLTTTELTSAAIRSYIDSHSPYYHFFAEGGPETVAVAHNSTLVCGVSGIFRPHRLLR